MASQQTRRIVWTGSIAAVTATGAWYGAGLKIKKEHKQVRSFPPFYPLEIFQLKHMLIKLHRRSKEDTKPHLPRR
jgi:hypothetical protein